MRDFFARQELAQKKTRRLLLLFSLAVLLLIGGVYLTIRVMVFWRSLDAPAGPGFPLWDPLHFLAAAGGTLLLVGGGSWFKIRQLRGGGGRVAEIVGGRRVPPETETAGERRLLNVVEEMAIASGCPVPDVYILDRERGINALAAGFGLTDAVICVTRGALHHLRRRELQGVIAHEFSHLLHADTLINIRMIGWLHGILLVSQAGEGMVRVLGRGRSRSGVIFIVAGFALYLLGYLGAFLGNLIKSAVSREREYLADAAAVQFTRDPGALAGALKKIGGLREAGRLAHPRAAEASHMYFSNGLRGGRAIFLSTHPPLLERILRLDPDFDGTFPSVEPLSPSDPAPAPMPHRPLAKRSGVEKAEPVAIVSGAAAATILASVGAPMREHAEAAQALLASLPAPLRAAARDGNGACALVYALLLDRDQRVRQRQMELLPEEETVKTDVTGLASLLSGLSPRVRLPLIELSLPALRQMAPDRYRQFKDNVHRLASADGRVTLFEYALRQVLLRHLAPRFEPPRRPVVQIYRVRGVMGEVSCVLSLLARVGNRDEEGARSAFAHGGRIILEPGVEPEFLPAAECAPSRLEQALATLAVTSPPIKRKVLAACLECLMHDQQITSAEIELFRAVADALGCPVPPWLSVASSP